jgi:hypothetical protein
MRLAVSTGTNSVGVSIPSSEDGNRSSFRNNVFSRNPVILDVTHYRQNSPDSAKFRVCLCQVFSMQNSLTCRYNGNVFPPEVADDCDEGVRSGRQRWRESEECGVFMPIRQRALLEI